MIEVPILIPFLGCIIMVIFLYLLFRINKNINGIKNLLQGTTIKNSDQAINKKENIKNTIPDENLIVAPMVGVAYLKSDPSKPPFVKIGTHVKQGDTVILIEAMKTFNEVRSPRSGVIKEILISDGKPVEFGEKLIIIE